jgi:hypothetical protein
MTSSIIPFTPEQLEKEFGKYTAAVVNIHTMQTKYADDFKAVAGETVQEKHLSAVSDRIEILAVTIESHKLEIGLLISMGNLMHLPQAAGFESMEEYLIADQRRISTTLINESKRYYQAYVLVKDHGVTKEQIGAASITQVDALTSEVRKVEKQRNEMRDKRAQDEGASEFRRLSEEKKKEVSSKVEEELQEGIKGGIDFVLNSTPETAHQVQAANGLKQDRPAILCTDFKLDPSTGKITYKAECYLEKSQINAFRKGNIRVSYVLADDPARRLTQEELADWIKEALD